MTKRATKADWKTLRLPKKRASLPVEREYTPREFELLQSGVIPQQMEDKWFIYFQDNHLYFHRSWTGFCVYDVEFEERPGAFAIKSVLANRNPRQYSETDDVMDARLLLYLIDSMLLGKHVPYPDRGNILGQWSSVGRHMLRDEAESENKENNL